MTKAERDKTNFVIEEKVYYFTGVRYFCVYNKNKTKLILLTRSLKEVSDFIGEKYGHWGINR